MIGVYSTIEGARAALKGAAEHRFAGEFVVVAVEVDGDERRTVYREDRHGLRPVR